MSGLITVQDYEDRASTNLPKEAMDYYRSGADDEQTLQLNRSSYDRLRIRPRVLRNVSNRDMKVKLFGDEFSMPIGISPTAFQKMAHPDGEVANAKGAASRKVPFTLSTLSNSSIEEVAKASKSPMWFQLYIYKERKLTEQLIRRARKAGFKALVITVDSPKFGKRRADIRNRFTLPPGLTVANFEGEQATGVQSQSNSGLSQYGEEQLDPALVWDDIKWVKKLTKLPVIVKGVLTKEDAEVAVKNGVDGIWVSNHGGRQLDSAPATVAIGYSKACGHLYNIIYTTFQIEALPEIVAVVGDRTTVIVDGGIRGGKDAFKALACGAKMVMIGRPALWGLAVNGQQGVEHVLDILKDELDTTMALAGCRTVADINREHVVHEAFYTALNLHTQQEASSSEKRKNWFSGIF